MFHNFKFLITVLTISLSMQSSASEIATPELMFIDLLPIKAGVTDERVETYFKKIAPVVKKHGLIRVGGYKIIKKMKGETNPNFVNIWIVKDHSTFDNIFSDPDYHKHIEFRNSTFDMVKAEMFLLKPSYNTLNYKYLINKL